MNRLKILICLLLLSMFACEKETRETETSQNATATEESPLDNAPPSEGAAEELAAETPAWAELQIHGAMQRVNLDKDLSATVKVAEALSTMNHGVGAVGGLLGEITVLDENIYVARSGGDEVGFDHYTNAEDIGDLDATLLFGAQVDAWQELELSEGTDRDALVNALETWRNENAPGQPVPFRVMDPAANVNWHVVDATRFPEGGAANCEERKELSHQFEHSGVEVTVVGIYTTEHTGVIVDHTTPMHAHVVLAAGPGGHLDTFTLSEGARLMVPATP
ncbi:hypothetical protein FRC96_18840 [Lujinxingia vulgaris]|uniref:Uncharacterized protein n=1 Tax=Lujinxingia vulgaris TaxID=2600176 RepID=A0A5C6WWB4_9DELT|nr:acetolactate decarboxylase [Lujinxingia vulgaris]TXD32133.1 hypothetical protein FRC96_18840 [Lujinxingia vulgaris]